MRDVPGATVVVEAPAAAAFHLFTTAMAEWWPPGLRAGPAPFAGIVLEPFTGGHWYERGVDARRSDRGRVRYWEPPGRLVLSWRVAGTWPVDPARAGHIDVRFTADGPGRTAVRATHRDPAGPDDGATMGEAFRLWGGWPVLLDSFATAVSADRLRGKAEGCPVPTSPTAPHR